MDEVRAARLTNELVGRQVAGWTISRYLGSGKSALVFEAEKSGTKAALKLFDPELVERFGRDTQLARISRELRVRGRSHRNLVQILDGGACSDTGHLFVVMEHIPAPNLEEAVQRFPRERIWPTISQVAEAARFLEDLEIAHRDIKPSNIAISDDFQRAILLDLGVIRPFGDAGLTDEDARTFVGTLRYSSPEFLFRQELDSRDGWRAITFYQLGAVLHDLIMRVPLFKEFSDPYAVLVEAVRSEQPVVFADDVPPELISLANNCLLKQPEARLALVTWDDFSPRASGADAAAAARERLRKRSVVARLTNRESPDSDDASDHSVQHQQLIRDVRSQIETIIRFECTGNPTFPRMELHASEGSSLEICVIFAASRLLGLRRRLHVNFFCDIVDVASSAVSISCTASLVPDGSAAPQPDLSILSVVFRGLLERTLLQKGITDSLYILLDESLQRDQRQELDSITRLSPSLPSVRRD